jgi:galactose mutarotase-like enzyme
LKAVETLSCAQQLIGFGPGQHPVFPLPWHTLLTDTILALPPSVINPTADSGLTKKDRV